VRAPAPLESIGSHGAWIDAGAGYWMVKFFIIFHFVLRHRAEYLAESYTGGAGRSSLVESYFLVPNSKYWPFHFFIAPTMRGFVKKTQEPEPARHGPDSANELRHFPPKEN
jgi:hypothetical protein